MTDEDQEGVVEYHLPYNLPDAQQVAIHYRIAGDPAVKRLHWESVPRTHIRVVVTLCAGKTRINNRGLFGELAPFDTAYAAARAPVPSPTFWDRLLGSSDDF